ncbi:T9SS type A sorting domain-containing protein [bacterium]|nr:T9SS type A sorting domain-containing protein [bacterium]
MRHKFVNYTLRYLILTILACFGLMGNAQDELESIIKAERDAFYKKQDSRAKRSGQNYDVTYQYLDIAVDPAVRYIRGSVYSECRALEDNFTLLALDLDYRMIVDSVQSEGVDIPFNHSGDEILIDFAAVDSGEMVSFTVYYQGDPTGNEQRGFYVDNHMTGPIAWTLSEPYGAYGWWPCKQQLSDKIDSFDMSVTVPKGNKAAGLGLLSSVDTLQDSSLVFNWKHRYLTTTYLVAVAVTNYEEFTHYAHFIDGDSLMVLEYVYPEYMHIADTQAIKVDPMITLFDSLCGPYPFKKEKYGHAMWGRGGGMEHQTMSFMSDFDFSLMAHELVHQWYGNKITCGSWQDIWLNEGFATFFTTVAYEYLLPSEYVEYLTITRDRVMTQEDGSVFVDDTTDVGRIFSGPMSYRKGAMVLQMLRWNLGDSIFYEGIRRYTSNAELCYDFARTIDLIDAMEEVSGEELDDFFNLWVYEEGYPYLNIRWYRTSSESVTFEVSETTSHPSVSFFPLKIPIQILGENGEDSIYVLDLTQNNQTFEFNTGFKVTGTVYDPWVKILARTNLLEGDHMDTEDIAVYPNPAESEVRVYVRDRKIDRIELYDMQGRLILEEQQLSKMNQPGIISVEYIKSGAYTVKAYSGDEIYLIKLIRS